MNPVRILIVDDHTLFREGVRAILKAVSDFEIVGEAATGEEAIDKVSTLKPDIILMDIQMPDINGVEATIKILKEHPEMGIIILTMLEDDDSLFSALRAGARGYVLKGADKAEMVKSIRAVANGEALFGPAIANRLTRFFKNPGRMKKQSAFPELTDREFEVLELIAKAHNNQEIAENLHISIKTVSNHISNVFNKLQVADRTEAIFKARDAGLGKSD
ncbi:MAG: response regulator transcription factor [Anaerolineales bacterium]